MLPHTYDLPDHDVQVFIQGTMHNALDSMRSRCPVKPRGVPLNITPSDLNCCTKCRWSDLQLKFGYVEPVALSQLRSQLKALNLQLDTFSWSGYTQLAQLLARPEYRAARRILAERWVAYANTHQKSITDGLINEVMQCSAYNFPRGYLSSRAIFKVGLYPPSVVADEMTPVITKHSSFISSAPYAVVEYARLKFDNRDVNGTTYFTHVTELPDTVEVSEVLSVYDIFSEFDTLRKAVEAVATL